METETTIDELSSHLSTLTTTSNELPLLDNRSPLSTFLLPSMSSCPMATDNYNHLLIYHHQTLILFHIPTFEIICSISILPLIECPISDICYYSISNCFLLSSSNTIYSLSSTKQIETIHKFSNTIWSITHTSNYIFICYLFGFSIEQWELNSNNGILLNTWLKDNLIESLDMGINCIRALNQYIGMTIKENNFSWRIDIFDIVTMNRISRGKTIQQDNSLSNWIGLLYPIDSFRWLFADGDQGLILIDQTDKENCKQKHIMKLGCNICLIRDINNQKYSSIIVQTYEALHLYNI
jgi:hypothetical protein